MSNESISYVLKRWPDQCRRVEELFQVDYRFREACEDYQELVCWMEKNRNLVPRQLEFSSKLLEELAREITDRLGNQDEPLS